LEDLNGAPIGTYKKLLFGVAFQCHGGSIGEDFNAIVFYMKTVLDVV
jgi:hypothetical protein